jgi:GTP cyclohydrolase FolE2
VTLEDVQSQADGRGIAIDEVGVSGIRYPVTVLDAGGGKQETVASIKLSARLPAGQRGAHLSRFIEVLEAQGGELSPHTIAELLRDLQVRLGSSSVRVEFDFPYFVRRCAPVSGASALMDYACALSASAIGDDLSLRLMVCVPVASVCPCSKAISDYGAHNQRSTVTIDAVLALDGEGEVANIWVEDLIEVAETSASSPLFPVLKRVDERHVTMHGYDNPVFVEDMVRAVTERLFVDRRVERFTVEAVSDESIHNHGAFARLQWPPCSSVLS